MAEMMRVAVLAVLALGAGRGKEKSREDACFVSSVATVCVPAKNPKELLVSPAAGGEPFRYPLDTAVRYVHAPSKAAIYLVAEDGRLGLVPWPRPETLPRRQATRFQIGYETRGIRVGTILAWTQVLNYQYAVDENGNLLITSGPLPIARLIRLTGLPQRLSAATIVAVDETDRIRVRLYVGAMAGGRAYRITKTVPVMP